MENTVNAEHNGYLFLNLFMDKLANWIIVTSIKWSTIVYFVYYRQRPFSDENRLQIRGRYGDAEHLIYIYEEFILLNADCGNCPAPLVINYAVY